MTERDWIREVEAWLETNFVVLCKAISQPIPFSGLRISPPLNCDEAKYFVLGREAGLFDTNQLGQVQSQLLQRSAEGSRFGSCRIFQYDSLPPRLIRETVCQLSTAADLILNRGWLVSHLQIGSTDKNAAGEPYGIDVLVRSRTGGILICVEIKRTTAELQKLVTDFRACCHRGPHSKDECGFPQNHPIYEFCTIYKPLYFWAVAPGGQICFRLNYDNASVEPEQLSSLPPRSLIE